MFIDCCDLHFCLFFVPQHLFVSFLELFCSFINHLSQLAELITVLEHFKLELILVLFTHGYIVVNAGEKGLLLLFGLAFDEVKPRQGTFDEKIGNV